MSKSLRVPVDVSTGILFSYLLGVGEFEDGEKWVTGA